jgi:hypothetical protein
MDLKSGRLSSLASAAMVGGPPMKTKTAIGFGVLLLASGCSVEASAPASSSEEQLLAADLKLPQNDSCRRVIAPIAVGLAQGAVGLHDTTGITVSRTSQHDVSNYTVVVDQDGPSVRYNVILSNSSCLLQAVHAEPNAQLANDVRTPAAVEDVDPVAKISVAPAFDACAKTVEFLADGAGRSAVGPLNLVSVDAVLDNETPAERLYIAKVNGGAFEFALSLSNSPDTKCAVLGVSLQ